MIQHPALPFGPSRYKIDDIGIYMLALAARRELGSAGEFRYCGHGSVTLYFSSGYMASLRGIPSSSRMGSSSWRYSSYWFLFSTLNLTPVERVSNQTGLSGCGCSQIQRLRVLRYAHLRECDMPRRKITAYLAVHVPSKTRTAEGKSLTRLAARRAAVMTEGEGTRS